MIFPAGPKKTKKHLTANIAFSHFKSKTFPVDPSALPPHARQYSSLNFRHAAATCRGSMVVPNRPNSPTLLQPEPWNVVTKPAVGLTWLLFLKGLRLWPETFRSLYYSYGEV